MMVKNKRTVLLRGYGNYYGHCIKAQVLEANKETVTVMLEGQEYEYDRLNGFPTETNLEYSGYQMDPNSLTGKVKLTEYRADQFGKIQS